MNFAVLPPEVNSARIFAGAGLGPMLAAASAWDGLAEELHAAAGSFASVTTGLAGDAWHGPASLAMTRAASPYVGWLNTAAGQAAQAAGQARLAASAFEATLAATVSPAMVAANRTRLASLVAANLLGQNAPAIAAAEAEYEQIWAQDVAAMFGYHSAASAVATQLAPIQEGLQQQLQTCWPSWLAGTWAAEMWASATSATTTLATQTSASEIEATPTSASGISATETSALGTPAIGISASASPATDKSASASLPTPTSWWWATAARE